MSVVKAKKIDFDKLGHGTPKKIIDKNYTVPILYENNTSVIQLPRTQLFTGMYESDGKYYCELLIPSDGAIYNMYQGLARTLESKLKQIPCFTNASFVGHMRTIELDNTESLRCLRVKFPQCKHKILTNVTKLSTQEQLSLAHVQKGSIVIPIVSLEYAYVVNGFMGFNLLVKELAIV
jgi:hypothetical protein